MSYRKFKFMSPGIFITEIDNSQLPTEPTAMGPALIGMTARGPALKPVQVNSFSDYLDLFGAPHAGQKAGDIWRDGNFTSPTYAAYAAQAWLRNNSPVTMVRLLGQTNVNADESGYAGWKTDYIAASADTTTNGGAFGLFVCEGSPPTSSATTADMADTWSTNPDVGTLAAVWYLQKGSIALSGQTVDIGTQASASITAENTGSAGVVTVGSQLFMTGTSANYLFTATSSFGGPEAPDGASWAANHFLTGTTSAMMATNIQTLINNSASADFSASVASAVVTVYAASVGTGGNTNQISSSMVTAFSVTGSEYGTTEYISGTFAGGVDDSLYTSSFAEFIRAADSGPTFKAVIRDGDGTRVVDSSFNFDTNSPKFIRKVFNTNPTLTNSAIKPSGDTLLTYWLGESFEGNVRTFKGTDNNGNAIGVSGSSPSSCYGVMLRLSNPDGSTDGGDYRMSNTKSPKQQFAKTGWFISQDLSSDTASYSAANMQKLFRFASRELGEETQRKVKVSIQNIKPSTNPNVDPFGTFTIAIRGIKDIDSAPDIIEQYNNCNLNPASTNYVAKKIGNRYQEWDGTARRYRTYGDYNNISNYIYIEMNERVDRGSTTPEYLPFGVFGPPRYLGFAVSGTAAVTYGYDSTPPAGSGSIFIRSGSLNPVRTPDFGTFNSSSQDGNIVKSKFKYPKLRLRASSSEGGNLTDPRDAYFGVDTTYRTSRFEPSVFELLRTRADDIQSWTADTQYTEYSWVFSLDDVKNINVTASNYAEGYSVDAAHGTGNRAAGLSYTAHTGSKVATASTQIKGPSSASYLNVLDETSGGPSAPWNQFTTCLHGASDGIDITERNPFNNTRALKDGNTNQDSYAYNSINVALDSLRDPEVVEYNLATMPGVTSNTLNRKLVEMCESRGDALAIIDLKNGYTPSDENGDSRTDRKGNVGQVIANKKDTLQLNSSYGCTYYPWVQIRDTINGSVLWAPPSVVALGAMSYSEANSQLWFAPAGFTRGGLSVNQAAGIPVVAVEQRLTSRQRDDLYEANINPIAAFPAEGIVIFGQKTLQLTRSALDRVNVRRLTIFLKKQISRFAATILFDQNVETTWNRFKGKVEPFLSDVKAGLGITDYRMILDETTTTPDLIDRNILYAKIFVKPARAIEFIAIDFIITDSGASFND